MDRVEALNKWFKDSQEKVLAIYSIFTDTFGEDRVDLQDNPSFEDIKSTYLRGFYERISEMSEVDFYKELELSLSLMRSRITPAIFIYFPEVTIENEREQKHTILELYVRVRITLSGKLADGPLFNRSKYSYIEFSKNYMHSHVMSIPKEDFTHFMGGCLGSGPINRTITDLHIEYSWDRWVMFAHQIDQYTKVESIQGVPYHHLSSLGVNGQKVRESARNTLSFIVNTLIRTMPNEPVLILDSSSQSLLQEFVFYFCKYFKDFNLNIRTTNGIYEWGSSYTDSVLSISNSFIEWFNIRVAKGELEFGYTELLRKNILKKIVIRNNNIITFLQEDNNTPADYSRYQGKSVCMFKGQPVNLTILPAPRNGEIEVPNATIVLHAAIIETIICGIITTLNLKYGEQNKLSDPTRKFYQV